MDLRNEKRFKISMPFYVLGYRFVRCKLPPAAVQNRLALVVAISADKEEQHLVSCIIRLPGGVSLNVTGLAVTQKKGREWKYFL